MSLSINLTSHQLGITIWVLWTKLSMFLEYEWAMILVCHSICYKSLPHGIHIWQNNTDGLCERKNFWIIQRKLNIILFFTHKFVQSWIWCMFLLSLKFLWLKMGRPSNCACKSKLPAQKWDKEKKWPKDFKRKVVTVYKKMVSLDMQW